MEKFTLKLPHYSKRNCYFKTCKYLNGNNALQILCDDEYEGDLICTCSVNAYRINAEDEIGIKNYSENTGMVQFLCDMDIIIGAPIDLEESGFVRIPYYKLTEKGKRLFA